MTALTPELNRKLSDALTKMPAFPKSVQRILELSRDINCPPKELIAVIEKDPVMTMKLLHMLNSAFYSFPKQISSVGQSVVYLGINTIKNMALSFAVIGTLPRHNDAGYDMQRYLMHSLMTASLARMLCQKFCQDGTDPSDCNLAGLLHDFGKIVFAQSMPDEFRKVMAYSEENGTPLHVAERAIIGVDHSVAGAMLVEKWQFQKNLSDAIRHHHDEKLPANTLQQCLYVADRLSKHPTLNNGNGNSTENFPPEIAARFGENCEEIIVKLGNISGVVAEAQAFAQSSKEQT